MDKILLRRKIDFFIFFFSIIMFCFSFAFLFNSIYNVAKSSSVNHLLLAFFNSVCIILLILSYIYGFVFHNKSIMNLLIIITFFVFMALGLVLTAFVYTVPVLGIIISIILFQIIEINQMSKRIILIATFSFYIIILVLQSFKLVPVNILELSSQDFLLQSLVNVVFIAILLYTVYLQVLRAQVIAESDFEKIVYDKAMTVDDLNEKIYHLKKNLNLLETTEKGIFNTTNLISKENARIHQYLEEYKMVKKDAPITNSVLNIEKATAKIFDLLEHPKKHKVEDDAASFEISLHTKTKIFKISKSGYDYEIMLKGILFKIIHTLMEKLVEDIKNNVTNFEIRGLIERDEVEKKVFGKVCKNNRLNTNITRIRTILTNEGLTIDLIESKDNMIRLKTISDKISIIDE